MSEDRIDPPTRVDFKSKGLTAPTASLLEKGSRLNVKEGDLLDERFLLERELGRGGMSVVFRARDLIKEHARDPDPFVAVKVMTGEISAHPDAWIALQREINKAQVLAHPRIVTVHDFKIDRVLGVPFAQMEELRGESLHSFLGRNPNGLNDSERWEALTIAIAEGLEYAHRRGIVHADMKPSNIFLTRDSGLKLLDFGISRFLPGRGADFLESLELGALTPAYASPQLFSGESPRPSDDVFALGIIAYELATGEHPFQNFLNEPQPAVAAADEAAQVVRPANVSKAQWRVIRDSLAFDDAQRPEDGADFLLRFRRKDFRARNMAITAVLLACLAVAGWLLPRGPSPEMDVSELSLDRQQQLSESLSSGQTALDMQDFNGALIHFSKAFEIHPYNPDAMDGLDAIVEKVVSSGDPQSPAQARDLLNQIEVLLEYPALAESSELNAYRRRLMDDDS